MSTIENCSAGEYSLNRLLRSRHAGILRQRKRDGDLLKLGLALDRLRAILGHRHAQGQLRADSLRLRSCQPLAQLLVALVGSATSRCSTLPTAQSVPRRDSCVGCAQHLAVLCLKLLARVVSVPVSFKQVHIGVPGR